QEKQSVGPAFATELEPRAWSEDDGEPGDSREQEPDVGCYIKKIRDSEHRPVIGEVMVRDRLRPARQQNSRHDAQHREPNDVALTIRHGPSFFPLSTTKERSHGRGPLPVIKPSFKPPFSSNSFCDATTD